MGRTELPFVKKHSVVDEKGRVHCRHCSGVDWSTYHSSRFEKHLKKCSAFQQNEPEDYKCILQHKPDQSTAVDYSLMDLPPAKMKREDRETSEEDADSSQLQQDLSYEATEESELPINLTANQKDFTAELDKPRPRTAVQSSGVTTVGSMAMAASSTPGSEQKDSRKPKPPGPPREVDFFQFSVGNSEGLRVDLEKYRGRVVIVTNIGTFADHAKSELEGLNSLAHCFGENLAIIGVPCNHFHHEPTANSMETLAVMEHVRPGQSFRPDPMSFFVTSHADVNGNSALPLFQFLKQVLPLPSDDQFSFSPGQKIITWNPIERSDVTDDFEKFVVRPDGKPVRRYTGKYLSVNLYHDISRLIKEFSLTANSAQLSSTKFLQQGNESGESRNHRIVPSELALRGPLSVKSS